MRLRRTEGIPVLFAGAVVVLALLTVFAVQLSVAIASLALVRRAISDAERVREANEQLTGANVELGEAKVSLEEVNAELAESNRALERSNEELERRARELVRYSRVSTQGRPFTPVDLRGVTDGVVEDLSEQNLISNAIKFRRDGVIPEVDVESKVDSGWVTITVRDNGIGFDPQYSRRIFRVFERLHGRGTYPGTGIGLALCRKIAERHGGTIVARSVPNEGSTFTVTMQTQRTEAVSDLIDYRRGASPTEIVALGSPA
jgi:nitrogen fixation/metabolism regulation signal transduction histidine kinase